MAEYKVSLDRDNPGINKFIVDADKLIFNTDSQAYVFSDEDGEVVAVFPKERVISVIRSTSE